MNKEVKKLKSPSADYIQRYFEFKMFGGKWYYGWNIVRPIKRWFTRVIQ
jgi:hypothetical protein